MATIQKQLEELQIRLKTTESVDETIDSNGHEEA